MSLVIYCADIGSIAKDRFGWARLDTAEDAIESQRGGGEIVDLIDAIVEDIEARRPLVLGFECPLFVPVPTNPLLLGKARSGEGNRSWSAGAGSGAMATGLVQVAWLLSELHTRAPDVTMTLDWDRFMAEEAHVFLWEAFVTGAAKGTTHLDDATLAVTAFSEALPDPRSVNAVNAERPLSLLGAAILWSGCGSDPSLLHEPCLVVKARASGG